jgi:GAF domain-containing protein
MTAIGPVEEHEFRPDIEIVALIAAIPAILTVVSRVTGMGFSAVARVTPDRWVCLAANDEIGFGLKPGGELKVETTICHEIRQSGGEVVIDHVGRDEVYRNHHTPAMYGFESYISVPIVLRDGSFYGTLCAIDPKPAKLNDPGIIGMFRLFAEFIARARSRFAQSAGLDRRGRADVAENAAGRKGEDDHRSDAEQRHAHVGADRRRDGFCARTARQRHRGRAFKRGAGARAAPGRR